MNIFKKKGVFVAIICLFLLGWTANGLFADIGSINLETPMSDGFFIPKEVHSPSDHIKEGQIHVYKDKIVLDIPNAIFAKFTDTNSMDPVIDIEAHSFEIIPESTKQIQVGDIISYKPSNFDGFIVHRVINISMDKDGWYAIVKGDNLTEPDPEKVRFEQVQGILVGIIY